MNRRILKSINEIGIFLAGGVGYHLIDRVLSHNSEQIAEIEQQNRDLAMEKGFQEANKYYAFAREQFDTIKSAVTERSANNNGLPISNLELIEKFNSIKQNTNSTIYELSKLGIQNWEASPAYNNLRDVIRESEVVIELLKSESNKNNFVSGITRFYEHLDSLTLLQESSLLHIIIYFVLLTCVINILAVLFGNEIIKYFNLEERFPKLSIFFKLRIKLQRYYLMWNIFILFIFCIGGAVIDILLFSKI